MENQNASEKILIYLSTALDCAKDYFAQFMDPKEWLSIKNNIEKTKYLNPNFIEVDRFLDIILSIYRKLAQMVKEDLKDLYKSVDVYSQYKIIIS